MTNNAPILIADIGGTNARFSLARDGHILGDVTVLACHAYVDLAAAAHAFLDTVRESDRPRRALFTVASPVTGDRVQFTNLEWAFSIDQLRQDLGLDALDVINDFTAIAWAVPRLKEDERQQVGGGEVCRDAPIAILGPGSGLGVAVLIPVQGGWTVYPVKGATSQWPRPRTKRNTSWVRYARNMATFRLNARSRDPVLSTSIPPWQNGMDRCLNR